MLRHLLIPQKEHSFPSVNLAWANLLPSLPVWAERPSRHSPHRRREGGATSAGSAQGLSHSDLTAPQTLHNPEALPPPCPWCLIFYFYWDLVDMDFPGGPSGKEPTCQCRRHKAWVWSLGWGSSQLQYSCLENPMDRGAWQATVPGVAKSWTWLRLRSTQVDMVLVVKTLPATAGDVGDGGSSPGSGRYPGAGHGNPLQYPCLENPMDKEPGGLQSIGLQSQTQLKWLQMHAQLMDNII